MIKNLALTGASIVIALIACEIILGFVYPEPPIFSYFVWPPYLKEIFKIEPGVMPGVYDDSLFSINSAGIRGDEFSADQDYRILAFGGSTTECILLDDMEAWPYLLQKNLGGSTGKNVWVGNVAKSGLNSRDNLVQLPLLLDEYPDIDAVVLMEGVNDLMMRLARHGDYDPDYLLTADGHKRSFDRAFQLIKAPYEKTKKNMFYEKTAIWRTIRKLRKARSIKKKNNNVMIQDSAGNAYVHARAVRKTMRKIGQLPDMTPALAEYRRNLNTMIDEASKRGVRVILVTQPSLYKENMTQKEKDLLWLGGNANLRSGKVTGFYSAEALLRGIKLYNMATLKVCRMRRADCVDAAAHIPKSVEALYDGVHFNEKGARMVADLIVRYLKSKKPFSDQQAN